MVSTARGPEGFLTLAVTDHGPGIPPEQQIHVFERFYRAEASDSQRTYGYGLGLYISRHLVEAMGGRIGVTSEPGLGSRFAFTLPEYNATDGEA
jgi:signal transduction histidine kinase